MEATFPSGSLTKSFIPLLITVTNEPSDTTIPQFSIDTYTILGRYINILPENGLMPEHEITLQLPRLPVATGRILFSTRLLSIGNRVSSINLVNCVQ